MDTTPHNIFHLWRIILLPIHKFCHFFPK
jgi:hypothetical protein